MLGVVVSQQLETTDIQHRSLHVSDEWNGQYGVTLAEAREVKFTLCKYYSGAEDELGVRQAAGHRLLTIAVVYQSPDMASLSQQ
ncbi:hypothetical protein GDO78_016956 [Eleutherodactylus coqui]|uniref:Uncharacterized protein n=1 Tax=Eleutherodactylus coqui TaxID=57060 RepID=A0A8J6EPU7_ELECQ|nr:hypothetical protein GDO78_016956 [Eleutherodactylus coqui]